MYARNARIALLLGLASGCAHHVGVPVLEPALVDIPADVRVVGVIDRSSPKNAGEHVLGTLEGVLTGEGLLSDKEGRAAALDELVRALEDSPRFEVVIPNVDGEGAKSGLFDKELDFRTVKRICKEAGCDALIALEAFDSDSATNLQIPGQHGYTGTPTAQRDTTVLASWRMYDAEDDQILDETRDHTYARTWTHTGDTIQEAQSYLPSQTESIIAMGDAAGWEYGHRVAPTWVQVSRVYYTSGDPMLKEAKHHVQAGDWDGAKAIWRDLIDSPDRKVKGKAEFNLALALEVEGALHRSLEKARDAAVDLHNGRSRDYVAILERRQADQERLEEQMAPPPPEDETTPPVKKVPPKKRKPAAGVAQKTVK